MTATSGEQCISCSWKLESSTTAMSVGLMFAISGSSGAPMFPPLWHRKPCADSIS